MMRNKSLGLIEVRGLVTAVEAADAAVKSADVELVGYEKTNGMGWITVKLLGDVSAIEAAIAASRAAAERVGEVISTCVIARLGDGVESVIESGDTVGSSQPEAPVQPMQAEESAAATEAIPVQAEQQAPMKEPEKNAKPPKQPADKKKAETLSAKQKPQAASTKKAENKPVMKQTSVPAAEE